MKRYPVERDPAGFGGPIPGRLREAAMSNGDPAKRAGTIIDPITAMN